MGIEALDLVVIVAAIAVGAFIKGATGGGLPQLAIPVMAVFLGVEHAVVVMAIPGVVANGLLVWSHRAEAPRTRHLPAMLAAGVVGSVAGTMLLHSLDGRVLSGVLALVIVTYIVLSVAKPGFTLPERVTRIGAGPVGLAAGGLQGATGISGPLLTTWLHGFGMPPRAYVFALSSLFFVFSTVQAITLAGVGLYTPTRLLESLLALLPILLALPLGVRAARKLSARTFQRVILVLLAASVVSLIHDTFAGAPS
ncbi:sulfite exporter TauE/SafE family protein [Blastococcus jejuensis]|uniref:Probable membrane transporter protein n=1 Tax=Blastococcus jejuensis TaxID=351224 RepID=A0ABP6P6N3_9ACTN